MPQVREPDVLRYKPREAHSCAENGLHKLVPADQSALGLAISLASGFRGACNQWEVLGRQPDAAFEVFVPRIGV